MLFQLPLPPHHTTTPLQQSRRSICARSATDRATERPPSHLGVSSVLGTWCDPSPSANCRRPLQQNTIKTTLQPINNIGTRRPLPSIIKSALIDASLPASRTSSPWPLGEMYSLSHHSTSQSLNGSTNMDNTTIDPAALGLNSAPGMYLCSPYDHGIALAQRNSLGSSSRSYSHHHTFASYADHCLGLLVQLPNSSTSNQTQSSPRGVKRSRSPELQGESLGYDRTDDGKWQARTRIPPFAGTRSYTNCFG